MAVAAAAGSIIGFDGELGHDGDERAQISLFLDNGDVIAERGVAIEAFAALDEDDVIDLLGCGRGSVGGAMGLFAPRPLAAFLQNAAAEASRLADVLTKEALDFLAVALGTPSPVWRRGR